MHTEKLIDTLVLHADLAKSAKSPKTRNRHIKRLSQTVAQISLPDFDPKKLRDALVQACVEHADFQHPAVLENDKIHINGTFDIGMLADYYYQREWRDL